MNVYTKCANYASETCPCDLAEKGQCLICSMCRGEDFCSCSDTVSYCIMQELAENGGHAKNKNQPIRCQVLYTQDFEGGFRLIRVRPEEKNCDEFRRLGVYAFIRQNDDPMYDCPVSVLYENKENRDDSLAFLIHLGGIKTACFKKIKIGDFIYVRGPYFNSLQGRKQIANLKNSNAVVIARGMGILPSLYAIAMLKEANNSVTVYFDYGYLKKDLVDFIVTRFDLSLKDILICDEAGVLTKSLLEVIDTCVSNQVGLLHLGMSDYPIKKIINYVDTKHAAALAISCDNNANMCCGEGICGACSKRMDDGRVVHLCKEQMDVYEYGKLL